MATAITQLGGNLQLTVGQRRLVRVKGFCFLNGQIGIWRYHYGYSLTAGISMALGEVAKAWADAIKASIAAITTDSTMFLGAKCEQLFPDANQLPGIAYVNEFGTIGGNALPGQVSGILTHQSTVIGRHNRGRSYIPFPAVADDSVDNTPTDGYVTRLLAVGTAMRTFVAATGVNGTFAFEPAVAVAGAGGAVTVVSERANQRWATQRRRGDYGRLNPPIIT